eukprot:6210737-Pleurochrysis_carterae.AAC.3
MQIHRARKLVPPSPIPEPERANPDIEGVEFRHEAPTTSYRNDYGRFGACNTLSFGTSANT